RTLFSSDAHDRQHGNGDRRLSQTRSWRLHRLRRDGRALHLDTGPRTHRSRARRRRDHLAWAKAPIVHARHQIACRTVCAFASRVTPASLISERCKRLAAKPKPSTRARSVPAESERALDSFVWRIFLSANRRPLRRNMRQRTPRGAPKGTAHFSDRERHAL